MSLLAYFCSVIFSFLYQFCHTSELNFKYLSTRSKCDHCGQVIKPYDLLPIISFIILRGHSRCCGKKLNRFYILGEVLAFTPLLLYPFTFVHIHFTLFLFTFLFLLTLSLYDIDSLTIDLNLSIIYVIVSMATSHLYFRTFMITFIITHCIYFFIRVYMGYGDIVLFNILSLFLPLNFFAFVVIFTFIIGGVIAFLMKCFINKHLKYIPLIPFVFISYTFISVFYRQLNHLLGGAFY